MENVVFLNRYRKKQKTEWLAKHGIRLDRFIENFITANFNVDFRLVTETYQQLQECQAGGFGNDVAWDYHDLREILESAVIEAFGPVLWQELELQYWYDARMFSKDEVVDRLLTRFIMGRAPRKTRGV